LQIAKLTRARGLDLVRATTSALQGKDSPAIAITMFAGLTKALFVIATALEDDVANRERQGFQGLEEVGKKAVQG